MKISYNWLKWYIPEAPDAQKLANLLTYHLAEVESLEKREDGDVVFDIKILPNRAHDLLSHQGVARELASLLNIKYVDPAPKYKIPESKPTKLKIENKTDKCRRYMARIVRNVKTGGSPEWVVKHLESIGQRSINNMVDAANLLMFNCGQPAHIFDLDKLTEEALIIRQAKEGEEMTTLDDKEVKLGKNNMVIADSKNVLGVAGIKGGKVAEVDNNTKNIIIEIANFDPTSIRKTGQALNIFTDARKRFENDLSLELAPYAMRELSALIFEICPEAIFEDVIDIYPKKQKKQELSFSADRISEILGLTVSINEIKNIFKRYNFTYKENKGTFKIVAPPMRLDLAIEEDMSEEIGRVLGYDKVKGKIPQINSKPKINETYKNISWARGKLLSLGYSEVMTYTFCDKGEVEVQKSASDKKFLRTNLSDGLRESIKLNQLNAPFLGIDKIKIFEIGTVFKKSGSSSAQSSGGTMEEMHVCFGDKKEIKEMSLEEFCESASPNAFAQVRTQPDHLQKYVGSAFQIWSLFPFIARDIAVFVPEGIKSEDVAKIIKENMGEMVVRGPELFDEFKKPGKISYAFRLIFQSYDRTLTDTEVNEIMTKITNKIKEKNGWQVR